MRSSPSAPRAPTFTTPAAAAAAAAAPAGAASAPATDAAPAAPSSAAGAAGAGLLILTVAITTGLASGCGKDTDPHCDQSFLRYDNFGSPFITNWCRSCHSVDLPPDMRQEAPPDVNFDTLDEIRNWSPRISLTAGDPQTATMPPAGGPSDAERAMLVEWLRCGAP